MEKFKFKAYMMLKQINYQYHDVSVLLASKQSHAAKTGAFRFSAALVDLIGFSTIFIIDSLFAI